MNAGGRTGGEKGGKSNIEREARQRPSFIPDPPPGSALFRPPQSIRDCIRTSEITGRGLCLSVCVCRVCGVGVGVGVGVCWGGGAGAPSRGQAQRAVRSGGVAALQRHDNVGRHCVVSCRVVSCRVVSCFLFFLYSSDRVALVSRSSHGRSLARSPTSFRVQCALPSPPSLPLRGCWSRLAHENRIR